MRLVEPDVAALALGVTIRRVRQLVAAKQLTNHGTDRRIRLDIAQVVHLAATRARNS